MTRPVPSSPENRYWAAPTIGLFLILSVVRNVIGEQEFAVVTVIDLYWPWLTLALGYVWRGWRSMLASSILIGVPVLMLFFYTARSGDSSGPTTPTASRDAPSPSVAHLPHRK